MEQVTRWSPDTCNCVIEYAWDDSLSGKDRTFSLHSVVKKCKVHENLSDEEVYNKVFAENRLKNRCISSIYKNAELVESKGNRKVLKSEKKVNWRFDKDRKLSLSISGFTPEESTLVNNSVKTIDSTVEILNE